MVESIRRPVLLSDNPAIGVLNRQVRRDANSFNLTSEQHVGLAGGLVDGKFDAGRPGVDDGYAAGHDNPSLPVIVVAHATMLAPPST